MPAWGWVALSGLAYALISRWIFSDYRIPEQVTVSSCFNNLIPKQSCYVAIQAKCSQNVSESKKVLKALNRTCNLFSLVNLLQVSYMLNRLYTKFDELSRRHSVFKVETVGDAWVPRPPVKYLKHNRDNSRRRKCDLRFRFFYALSIISIGHFRSCTLWKVIFDHSPPYCFWNIFTPCTGTWP